jgi:hypothetical protein
MASSNSNGQVVIRDYQHAARIFTDANYRLSPKYGFLFYVEFDFDTQITNISNTTAQEMGMIVKSVNLPSYNIEVKQHNAYNRKNYVQNAIKYDPVTITFHDDQADNVLSFWYDYYSFYYRDSDYASSTYYAPNKYQSRPTFDWGYTPRPSVGYNNSAMFQPYQYIQSIRIYSMYQQHFDEYQLVNPIITSFKHGKHQQGNEGGTLEHEMSIQFETVKYLSGYVTTNSVGGFIDLHYDTTPSPLAPGDFVAGAANPTATTDATSNYTSIFPPPLTTPQPVGATSLASSAAAGFRSAVLVSSNAPTNAGGFSIPSFSSLGSLNQGIPTSQQIQNQLQAAGVGIASNAVNKLANGVVQGVASAIGPNGGAIIGLAAAAIKNPNALLKTAEQMAVGAATAAAGQIVNKAVTSAVNTVTSVAGSLASSALDSLNSTLAFGGSATLTGEVSYLGSQAAQLLPDSVQQYFNIGSFADNLGF